MGCPFTITDSVVILSEAAVFIVIPEGNLRLSSLLPAVILSVAKEPEALNQPPP
jgi:hypothetical protein